MEENKTSPAKEERKGPGGRGGGKYRKRVCRLCYDGEGSINYKKTETLIKFVSNKGKILPRRLSGSCAKHQRAVAREIKKSRAAGFMPYTVR